MIYVDVLHFVIINFFQMEWSISIDLCIYIFLLLTKKHTVIIFQILNNRIEKPKKKKNNE